MITLTDGTTTITLPIDIEWIDEHTWSAVVQTSNYSLTGAMVVETGAKLAGRAITLQSPAEQAVITGAELNQLKTWANTPGKTLVLAIRGGTKNVMFVAGEGAVVPKIIGHWADPIPDTALYFITLKLMEI